MYKNKIKQQKSIIMIKNEVLMKKKLAQKEKGK